MNLNFFRYCRLCIFLLCFCIAINCNSSDSSSSGSQTGSGGTSGGGDTIEVSTNCDTTTDMRNSPLKLNFPIINSQDTTQSLDFLIYANQDIDCLQTQVKQAVIVIHGNSRDAGRYYQNILDSAQDTKDVSGDYLILVPQFFVCNDSECDDGVDDSSLYWSSSGAWVKGHTSSRNLSFFTSSYSVIEELIERLIDKNYFPSLTKIRMIGFSAGGQFVNRFTAGNSVQTKAQLASVDLSYTVGSPSSYLYFNTKRCQVYDGDNCKLFSDFDSSTCTNFNEYHYGLEDLNLYMTEVGEESILQNYLSRDVSYFIGSLDRDQGDLDESCAANAQGEDRYQRSLTYYDYLNVYFSEHNHTHQVLSDVTHSSSQFFSHAKIQCHLFNKQCD